MPSAAEANAEGLRRLCEARPLWIEVRPARELLPVLQGRAVLHAGPPLPWGRMATPMQQAIAAACLLEGWARTREEALALAGSGEVALAPCNDHGAVGPMTGVISPSMPTVLVRDEATGLQACSTLNEGMGRTFRFGACDEEALARQRWIRDVLGPALQGALQAAPVALSPLMGQALQMGDELHMRNAAASALLFRTLAPALVAAAPRPALPAIVEFLSRDNDQFFLNLAMAAAKATARSLEGLPGCTLVCVMARNGVEFGIKVAGLPGRWFTAPAPVVEGLYFPGFTRGDAVPDLGDSAIMETIGLGAFAMAASPPVTKIVGAASVQEAIRYTQSMAEISVGTNPAFPVPVLDFQGVPCGIDVRRVVELGITPAMNTAIAHRTGGRMIGAGIARAPLACFIRALEALAGQP